MLLAADVAPTSVNSSSAVWCWQAVVRQLQEDTWTTRLVRRFSKAVGESCWKWVGERIMLANEVYGGFSAGSGMRKGASQLHQA